MQPNWSEVTKLFVVFVKTLQYSYLFGILPMLMIAAVDDIFYHIKRINPVVRMLLVGVIAFVAAEFLYGSRGGDSGLLQFVLYGLVGFVPGHGIFVAGARGYRRSWLRREVCGC